MVRRPKDWADWTKEKRMNWLRKQRTKATVGGRKVVLKPEDAERVWGLMKQYGNKSMVADLVGVSRSTINRFLNQHPTPATFIVKDDMQIMDFPEMQIWRKRVEGFANNKTINTYMTIIRQFYEYMKQKHPERAKPSLWTSDDITEFVYSKPAHLWHAAIVPLRSLALKAQREFPQIDLGMLPTKKTHKAKRSLAGKDEYYFTPEQVGQMIDNATTMKAKAMIAFLYNTACRSAALIKVKIEDLKLNEHFAKIIDKGSIIWHVYGLTDKTCYIVDQYLRERGYPKSGLLFPNGGGKMMTQTQVNDIIRDAGQRAGIKGKILTAKSFRKSFVKNALDIAKVNPVVLAGTGKQIKTAMCVGWTLEVIMTHYAPQLKGQIEQDRKKFKF